MTSIVLGNIGTSIGGTIGGPTGAAIGGLIGSYAGSVIDRQIFATDTTIPNIRGAQLTELGVQSSTYGEMLPIVYGTVRTAGNIIWAEDIKETATTNNSTTSGGKGGGGNKVSGSQTTFSYSSTLAIAICEGPIDGILRVWADSKIINPNDGTYRLYKGTEDQTADTLIESIQGVGKTPAYRGIAYVVIENFPLADYGNRIPNFTFEVQKKIVVASEDGEAVEDMLTAITMIPGAGEFVYDDTVQSKIPGELVGSSWAQKGDKTRINQNNRDDKADSLVALDQLAETCANVEWISVVAVWFGDDLDVGTCVIKPGVEFKNGAITAPDSWAAGGYTRATARQITLVDDVPRYGGTPSDTSLLRYIREIKNRGYNVMFYPMIFMDVENKPWRGRLTGSASDVADFFTKTNGYNEFINYYANLVKDDVDAFVIGSELVGLTSVQAMDNSFPAVDALVDLAADVKTIVGGDVKVTYAADWSEYHHTTGGWYNLDPLWASIDIDVVGIDAYFPLTDEAEPAFGFDNETLKNGWVSGEGYDWYYTDSERTTKASLAAPYAWKNIAWWWNNTHTNPDASPTEWMPASKPIWFTEFGFPSVDGASNQPNVFVDPDSSENGYPRFSRQRVDFRAQRNAIKATLEQWAGSEMVEHLFLWTWDARPFPFWPDLKNVWADGPLWKTGHWVQGKFGMSSLAAIVYDLSKRAGLEEAQIDVSRLNDLVDGCILKNQITIRKALDNLRHGFFFDAVESDGVVKYVARGEGSVATISDSEILPTNNATLKISRIQELELPQKIDVLYLNKMADYQTGNQHSQRMATNASSVETIGLPIVFSDQAAKNIADITLYNMWLGRTAYSFVLPIKYAAIEPCDVITINSFGINHTVRVVSTNFGNPGMMKIEAVAEDSSIYDFYAQPGQIAPQTNIVTDPGDTVFALMDLPSLPSDTSEQSFLRYAVCGLEAAWKGAVIFRCDDGGANYSQLMNIDGAAAIGVATTILADGTCDIFDEENSVTINLYGSAELESFSDLAILNGANAAKLGDEIIQFKTATFISDGQYILSGLLRGRLGTEWATATHAAGEEFILLDGNVVKEAMPANVIGMARLYKGVSVGHSLADSASAEFTYNANALKPYSPVHIAGVRDGSDNLTITWLRRTRVGGGLRDFVDVPLAEESEQYEVDIMDGADVIRTISGLSTESASYSAADQTTDFGSPQSSVSLRVYQLSSVVGRGTAGAGVV